MGFKADISFLEKLTMGATATRATIKHLEELGFVPIELERYSTSNKIWTTKVKRLRLADILCVRTGIRVEVRGKSKLEIKMSDSPSNPDRRWDSGLRDADLVGLVSCVGGATVRVRAAPVFFAVEDLRKTAGLAKLGPPKLASEGAERDLTWPSVVPSDDGEVLEVTDEKITVRMASGRKQTYRLEGRNAFVQVGDQFVGKASILAGAVSRIVDPKTLLGRTWSPVAALQSKVATDRHAAAKALASGKVPIENPATLLSKALKAEDEPRTALEIAGALARLGVDDGFEYLESSVAREASEDFPAYLRMETVLILSEIAHARSAAILDKVAGDPKLKGNELRQAAVWGLGRAGVRSHARVVKYIADAEDDVALHAIAALGRDSDIEVIDALADMLVQSRDVRERAAASEALRMIGSQPVANALVRRAAGGGAWIPATLGRLPKEVLAAVNLPDALARMIEPIGLLSDASNWLAQRRTATAFQFLLQQDLLGP